MNLKGFIAWIFSEDKKPCYKGSNGIVQEGDKDTLLKPDGQPAHLQQAPDGWDETLVKWGTSLTAWGFIREMTVPMKFGNDGFKILKHILWTKGFEAVAYFALHKLVRAAYPIQYDVWFIGELDFTQFKQDSDTATIQVMEGGASKLLKANENTSYSIDIHNDAEKKILYLDGLPFTNKISWVVYAGQQQDFRGRYLGMGIVSQEGTTQGVLVQDVFNDQFVLNPLPNNDWFTYSVDKTITCNIKIKGKVQCTHSTGIGHLRYYVYRTNDFDTTSIDTIVWDSGAGITAGAILDVEYTGSFTITPNQRLQAGAYIFESSSAGEFVTLEDFEFSMDYEVSFTPTYAECLTPFTVLKRLAEKMFDGKYNVQSTFLQGLDDILLTSGNALRKYKGEAAIQTSFLDFFQSLKTRGKKKYSVGYGILNDVLIFEELDYFFQNDIILDIGTVTDLEVTVAKDLLFNTIKVGSPNQTIDKVNGKDEVNVTQLYTTPNTRVVKELNLVSVYRKDMYGIEVTRIDLYLQDTTDNKADNEVFMINAQKVNNAETTYYTGPFEITELDGRYFIDIPSVLIEQAPGTSIRIDGSSINNGTYTIKESFYASIGYTLIEVFEMLVPESVAAGTLYVQNNVSYILNRLAYSSITGVLHPDGVFNLELSPKIDLINTGGLLHSLFDKQELKFLKFELGDKNSELVRTLNGVTISEKADLQISTLQAQLFQPYYFSATVLVPDNAMAALKANPFGRIKFKDDKTGLILYGRMWDGGIKPEPNDTQKWVLIASPNQNLSRFI